MCLYIFFLIKGILQLENLVKKVLRARLDKVKQSVILISNCLNTFFPNLSNT